MPDTLPPLADQGLSRPKVDKILGPDGRLARATKEQRRGALWTSHGRIRLARRRREEIELAELLGDPP